MIAPPNLPALKFCCKNNTTKQPIKQPINQSTNPFQPTNQPTKNLIFQVTYSAFLLLAPQSLRRQAREAAIEARGGADMVGSVSGPVRAIANRMAFKEAIATAKRSKRLLVVLFTNPATCT